MQQICAGCGEEIDPTEDSIIAIEKTWHVDHFRCTICKCAFPGGKFLVKDDKPYCSKDYHEHFAKRCAGCGEAIVGKRLEALNKSWHPEHFVCCVCKEPLSDLFRVVDGKPVCETCRYERPKVDPKKEDTKEDSASSEFTEAVNNFSKLIQELFRALEAADVHKQIMPALAGVLRGMKALCALIGDECDFSDINEAAAEMVKLAKLLAAGEGDKDEVVADLNVTTLALVAAAKYLIGLHRKGGGQDAAVDGAPAASRAPVVAASPTPVATPPPSAPDVTSAAPAEQAAEDQKREGEDVQAYAKGFDEKMFALQACAGAEYIDANDAITKLSMVLKHVKRAPEVVQQTEEQWAEFWGSFNPQATRLVKIIKQDPVDKDQFLAIAKEMDAVVQELVQPFVDRQQKEQDRMPLGHQHTLLDLRRRSVQDDEPSATEDDASKGGGDEKTKISDVQSVAKSVLDIPTANMTTVTDSSAPPASDKAEVTGTEAGAASAGEKEGQTGGKAGGGASGASGATSGAAGGTAASAAQDGDAGAAPPSEDQSTATGSEAVSEDGNRLTERRRTMVLDMNVLDQALNPKSEQAHAVKRGHLSRKGDSKFKPWKTRYFIMEDYVLYFFKSEKEDKCLGKIVLPGCDLVPNADKEVDKPFSFIIRHPNDPAPHVFAAAADLLRQGWIEALKAVVVATPERINASKYKLVKKRGFTLKKGLHIKESASGSYAPSGSEVVGAADDEPEEGDKVVYTDVNGKVVLVMVDSCVDSASPDKLIALLCGTEQVPEGDFQDVFLLTFRHLMTPHELIERLMVRFNIVPPDGATPEQLAYVKDWAPVIQARVAKFVQLWMDTCWHDFHNDDEMIKMLMVFLEMVQEMGNKAFDSLAQSMETKIAEKIKQYDEMIRQQEAAAQPSTGLSLDDVAPKFMDLSPVEIGRQLTLMDSDAHKKIRPEELVLQLWSSKSNASVAHYTANLNNYVDGFNRTSFWVASEICLEPDYYKRVEIVKCFITIAREMGRLCNYNSLMAIISGLNSASVQRLKHTWEGVPSRMIAELHKLESMMDPKGNYAAYRDRKKPLPCVPFCGLTLKDLIFLDDGNPKYTEDGLVNFDKLRRIYQAVHGFIQYNKSEFSFPVHAPTQDYVRNALVLNEQQCYKYSMRCEPRGAVFVDGKFYVPAGSS